MALLLLALRFLVELCLFAAWALVGYWALDSRPLGVLVGGGLAAVVAAAWGVFLSPRRRFDLPLPVRVTVELVLFGAASVALAASGHTLWGVLLFTAEAAVLVGLAGAGFRPGQDPAAPRS